MILMELLISSDSFILLWLFQLQVRLKKQLFEYLNTYLIAVCMERSLGVASSAQEATLWYLHTYLIEVCMERSLGVAGWMMQ